MYNFENLKEAYLKIVTKYKNEAPRHISKLLEKEKSKHEIAYLNEKPGGC